MNKGLFKLALGTTWEELVRLADNFVCYGGFVFKKDVYYCYISIS